MPRTTTDPQPADTAPPWSVLGVPALVPCEWPPPALATVHPLTRKASA